MMLLILITSTKAWISVAKEMVKSNRLLQKVFRRHSRLCLKSMNTLIALHICQSQPNKTALLNLQ